MQEIVGELDCVDSARQGIDHVDDAQLEAGEWDEEEVPINGLYNVLNRQVRETETRM